jgi:DNA invertase Pin-like site-specific DNA recombinase
MHWCATGRPLSTDDQKVDLQHDALKQAGFSRVFSDTASGALDRRPQLDALLDYIRANGGVGY